MGTKFQWEQQSVGTKFQWEPNSGNQIRGTSIEDFKLAIEMTKAK